MLRAAGIALAAFLALSGATRADEFDGARAAMLRSIQAQTIETQATTGVPVIDPRILAAMGRVPRHRFVPEPLVGLAYANMPLPLGHGQNLAQPFIVALMTQLLDVRPGHVVYETGTDTGYQAAILAELGAEVFSMEVVEPLAQQAEVILRDLGTPNIALKAGDGYLGWPEHGPYDRILLKEAVDHVPPALLRQLKVGGILVMPLGPASGGQHLSVIEKKPDGTADGRRILPVNFAPIQGGIRI